MEFFLSMHFGLFAFLSFAGSVPLSPNGPYNTKAGPRDSVINVHLVPHTHDDVGWLKTVDELYLGDRNEIQISAVQYILDSVVESLAANPDRKFIYVEMAFFSRWWRRANDLQRYQVSAFLDSGQLEFINGGWASNDEATATFVDIIDQHTLGATYIVREFGYNRSAVVGFQADPFGHSHFQAKAYADMGMISWFFGRSDFQDFAVRRATGRLETIHSEILVGSMDGYGPPPGFDWNIFSNDEPLNDDEFLGEPNIERRVQEFVDHCEQQALVYNKAHEKTKHIMLTMGSDFEYMYAHTWFKNMDKLIHYANLDGRVNVFYSTPTQYSQLRLRDRRQSDWEVRSDYDWFPYCDGEAVSDGSGTITANPQAHAFWTGYFTSRPELKRLVRVASAVLEACRLAELETWPFTTDLTTQTARLWEALSVVQHHDGVSGTARQRVAEDYADMLQRGIDGCMEFMQKQVVPGDTTEGMNRSITYNSMLVGRNQPHLPPTLPSELEIYFASYQSSVGDTVERPGQASGAYIFRPACLEGNVTACEPKRVEADWAKLEVFPDRVEWKVGPLPTGTELVLIFDFPKIRNGQTFFTDSNGYSFMERKVNFRPTWNLVVTDPVSSNYYPVTAGIGIQDAHTRLTVTPDRAVGGSSLREGQIEVMLHRRTFRDDDRGVGEPLDERDSQGRGIVVSGTTYFRIDKVSKDSDAIVDRSQLRPPISAPGNLRQFKLPPHIVLTHVHRVDVPECCQLSAGTDCVLVRLMHELGTAREVERPNPPSVDLSTLFPNRALVLVSEVTLNAGKLINTLPSTIVEIQPGQLRTFVLQHNRANTPVKIETV